MFGLRTWIFRFTYLVFKTMCVDRGKPLWEGAFFFTRRTLFPPLAKRNTRDKAKGLYINSERLIRGAGRAWCIINLELAHCSYGLKKRSTGNFERVDFAEGFAPCW